jgi:membrane-associated phospholipid phosphatase
MKKKIAFISLAVLFSRQVSFSQDTANHYSLKLKIEIPAVVAGAAFCAYNFAGISKKTSSDPVFVEGLNKSDVNWFDRWGVRPYNKTADNQSYIPFYVAVPLPLVVFVFDKKLRKDFFKLSFLYAEAMISTGVLYSSAAHFVNRLRPLVYDAESPLNKRTSSDSKKSFFAGHVALVATSTFFVARVLADYHPDSRFKWLYYSIAGAATVTTAYLRQAAGEHFLSDILVGTTVGTLSGLITPALHKNSFFKNQRLSLYPFNGHNSNGFTALYRL